MATDAQKLEALGRAIRHARRARDLTQEDLAELLGYNPKSVGEIERGRKDSPVTTILRIAEALEIVPSDLYALYDRILAAEPPA